MADMSGAERAATVPRERRETVGEVRVENPRIRCTKVSVYYGETQAVRDISIDIGHNEILALIGPSGCGKTTFLRCMNRMNDTIAGCRVEGEILVDGVDVPFEE